MTNGHRSSFGDASEQTRCAFSHTSELGSLPDVARCHACRLAAMMGDMMQNDAWLGALCKTKHSFSGFPL